MTEQTTAIQDLSGDYQLDPAHTRIGFVARHAMVTKVRGQFRQFEGSAHLDPTDPTKSSAQLTVEVASIDTGNEQRDGHLRSADFFDSETYPEITFVSTSVQPAGDGYRVTGDLTIRGVTRPVELAVEVEDKFVDPWGNERVGVTASGSINRTDWGLNWNQTLEAGRLLVSEKINLAIETALVRPAGVPTATA